MRKIFVLDTSVLLYDKFSIHSFAGNDVVIPLRVIDELDKFKESPGVLGESARYVNRFLDDLRNYGSLLEGVKVPDIYCEDQIIRISLIENLDGLPEGLREDRGDNRILSAAFHEATSQSKATVVVITKDINLRVKCDALGIKADDLIKDQIAFEETAYTGWRKIIASKEEIDKFFQEGSLEINDDLHPQEFVLLTDDRNSSALGVHSGGVLKKLNRTVDKFQFQAKNMEQNFAMEALLNPDVNLITLTGLAGSGKTFITLVAALAGLQSQRYNRIVISRSIQPVGRDLGYLPGDIDEKMQPWLAPILDNFKTIMHDKSYFEMMMERGELEVAPLAYIRGRTFNDAFVMVDEAQNATIHELKTLITRVGRNSKIVLLGDTEQIDTPYINKLSNGLSIVAHKFMDQDCAAHIKLAKGQRSDLASIASVIL